MGLRAGHLTQARPLLLLLQEVQGVRVVLVVLVGHSTLGYLLVLEVRVSLAEAPLVVLDLLHRLLRGFQEVLPVGGLRLPLGAPSLQGVVPSQSCPQGLLELGTPFAKAS